jgi:hypothetical protein
MCVSTHSAVAGRALAGREAELSWLGACADARAATLVRGARTVPPVGLLLLLLLL